MSTKITAKKIPKHPDRRREWIKYQLRIRGTSLSEVARELGVSRQAVGKALSMPYLRIEKAIARALGVQPWQIWPERYTNPRRKDKN